MKEIAVCPCWGEDSRTCYDLVVLVPLICVARAGHTISPVSSTLDPLEVRPTLV